MNNGNKPTPLVFRTVGGVELEYEPVSALALEYADRGIRGGYKKAGAVVDIPTYTVELAGGATQIFEMDKETAATKPEWQEQWDAYIADTERMNNEINLVRNKMILSAVKVTLPEDASWMRRQKRWGIELPQKAVRADDESDDDYLDRVETYQEELRIHYLQTELLKTVEDAYGIVGAVMAVSMRGALTEEQIDAASASFRNTQKEAKREANITDGTQN